MLLNFTNTFEALALNFEGHEEQHHRFVHDAQRIINAILFELQQNNSIFHDYMRQLRQTASFVNQIEMDMPLGFETFMPLRLPMSLSTIFNESQRSVQLLKANYLHPFFFGNALNAKCMNMRLQRDLELAFSRIKCMCGYWGAIYDLKYTPLSYNRVPFAHSIFAVERGAVDRGIRFDFILALEFDGAELPLPSYFQAPISYKWLAYGLVPLDDSQNSANWGVLLPRWQSADVRLKFRCHNMLLLLHRLLYAQHCYCFAVPFMVKLCFFMTTVDRGEGFKRMSVAELLITTLGHQVFRNFYELIVLSSVGDPLANMESTQALREQQLRGKGIFAMLAKGMQMNLISSQFINIYFQIDRLPLTSNITMRLLVPQKPGNGPPTPPPPPPPPAAARRKRGNSI